LRFSQRDALAPALILWALLPCDVRGQDAVFDGFMVADRVVAAGPGDAATTFRGQVINDAEDNRQSAFRAAKGALNAALPLGTGPQGVQHSRAERPPQKPQIGIGIGVSIGGSSNAPARKPSRIGPVR
jgi:hypothetical protein